MQIVGDEEFNEWARKTGQSLAEKDNPIVYVTVARIKTRSFTKEKLKLEMAA